MDSKDSCARGAKPAFSARRAARSVQSAAMAPGSAASRSGCSVTNLAKTGGTPDGRGCRCGSARERRASSRNSDSRSELVRHCSYKTQSFAKAGCSGLSLWPDVWTVSQPVVSIARLVRANKTFLITPEASLDEGESSAGEISYEEERPEGCDQLRRACFTRSRASGDRVCVEASCSSSLSGWRRIASRIKRS